MPIDFTKSKYSAKARMFLSKDPLEFPLLTLKCGSVRSGKTINVIYKIPQYLYFYFEKAREFAAQKCFPKGLRYIYIEQFKKV